MHVYLVSGMHPHIGSTGGVRPYVLGLARWLSIKGAKVTIVGAGPRVEMNGMEFESVASDFPLSNYQFIRSLWRWVGHHSVEVGSIVHAHRPDDLYPFVGRTSNCALVCTLHGSPWRGISQRRTLGRIPYLVAERRSLRAAHHVISVSESGLREYVARYPWLVTKSSVIPVGIDLSLFHPAQGGSSHTAPKGIDGSTLLFAGRLEPEKRVDVLLDAIREMPDSPKVVIAGDGTLEREVRVLSADLRVRLVGRRSAEEMASLYSAADALVLPSSFEGLPTVALEAMACGTPVIATDVGDLPRLVTEGVTGFFFDGTAKGLRETLERHAGDLEEMRPKCVEVARSFGWDTIAAEVYSVYQKLEVNRPAG